MKVISGKLLLTLSTILGVIVLSGCDYFPADPVAFTRVDDVAVVRMCLPMKISSIELKTYTSDDDYEGTAVWTASGAADVDEGAEFALGQPPAGLQITSGSDDVSEVLRQLGQQYGVTIDGQDAYGAHEFFAVIDASDFDGAVWLDEYGPVDSPCVRAPCPPGYACHNQWPQPSGPALAPAPTWTTAQVP